MLVQRIILNTGEIAAMLSSEEDKNIYFQTVTTDVAAEGVSAVRRHFALEKYGVEQTSLLLAAGGNTSHPQYENTTVAMSRKCEIRICVFHAAVMSLFGSLESQKLCCEVRPAMQNCIDSNADRFLYNIHPS